MTRARDVANVLTAANTLSTDIETAAAITTHAGLTDPHTGYLQESTFSANQIPYKDGSNNPTGSANLTFNGTDLSVNGKISSTVSSGDEGGEIFLNKSVTNTTINGGVTVDVWQNRLRFFEQGGTARGYYLDMTAGGAGVGTNLGSSGGMTEISTVVPNASSIDFNSIPGTYKRLLLQWHGIKTSDDTSFFDIRFNNTSTASYPIKQFNGGSFGSDDSGTNISASNNQGTGNSPFNQGTQGTSYSTTSSGTLLIDNYASTTYYKPYYLQFAKAGINIRWIWGSYISASAITSINIFRISGTGNIQTLTGGYIKLYGIS